MCRCGVACDGSRRRAWRFPSTPVGAAGMTGSTAGRRGSVAARGSCAVGSGVIRSRIPGSPAGLRIRGFKRSAKDLKRLAGLSVSAERLRQIVEGEGQRAQTVQATGAMPAAWQGTACRVTPDGPSREPSRVRVYVGVDGVMVPMVTTAEKQLRASRRRRCRRPKRRHCRQSNPGEPCRAPGSRGTASDTRSSSLRGFTTRTRRTGT